MQPLVTEQVLIDALPNFSGDRILVISPGRGQAGWHWLEKHPQAKCTAWYLDLHDATLARELAESQGIQMEVSCSADLPAGEVELVAMPVMMRGEAELTRELLQQAYMRLIQGGYLVASVDNPSDSWLHEQMQVLFEKVTVQSQQHGKVYWGKKVAPLKRERDFSCQFQFRDQDRLIQAISRPGVFSHRRLDPGARQLINAADIGPEDRVMDYGCGSGGVALACAIQTSNTVYAVDSNARAIECTRRNAELNNIPNIQTVWNADGKLDLKESIDIALTNPPYFGDQKISKHFIDACLSQLRSKGALLIVTKSPTWISNYIEDRVEDLTVAESGKYFIVYGCKN